MERAVKAQSCRLFPLVKFPRQSRSCLQLSRKGRVHSSRRLGGASEGPLLKAAGVLVTATVAMLLRVPGVFL